MEHTDVIAFWFEELTPEDWFREDVGLDVLIKERFFLLHQSVIANERWMWRESAEGSLAEIIVIDQFSRNLFRNDPEAYAHDDQALALAQVAVEKGFDVEVDERKRPFFYLPYMHSESAVIHEEALKLFGVLTDDTYLRYERAHKDVIDRFGRYPHRNQVLGRKPTAAELQFMENEGRAGFSI